MCFCVVDVHSPSVGREPLKFDLGSTRGTGTFVPGYFASAVVRPRNIGLDEIRCNVNDHLKAGMRTL